MALRNEGIESSGNQPQNPHYPNVIKLDTGTDRGEGDTRSEIRVNEYINLPSYNELRNKILGGKVYSTADAMKRAQLNGHTFIIDASKIQGLDFYLDGMREEFQSINSQAQGEVIGTYQIIGYPDDSYTLQIVPQRQGLSATQRHILYPVREQALQPPMPVELPENKKVDEYPLPPLSPEATHDLTRQRTEHPVDIDTYLNKPWYQSLVQYLEDGVQLSVPEILNGHTKTISTVAELQAFLLNLQGDFLLQNQDVRKTRAVFGKYSIDRRIDGMMIQIVGENAVPTDKYFVEIHVRAVPEAKVAEEQSPGVPDAPETRLLYTEAQLEQAVREMGWSVLSADETSALIHRLQTDTPSIQRLYQRTRLNPALFNGINPDAHHLAFNPRTQGLYDLRAIDLTQGRTIDECFSEGQNSWTNLTGADIPSEYLHDVFPDLAMLVRDAEMLRQHGLLELTSNEVAPEVVPTTQELQRIPGDELVISPRIHEPSFEFLEKTPVGIALSPPGVEALSEYDNSPELNYARLRDRLDQLQAEYVSIHFPDNSARLQTFSAKDSHAVLDCIQDFDRNRKFIAKKPRAHIHVETSKTEGDVIVIRYFDHKNKKAVIRGAEIIIAPIKLNALESKKGNKNERRMQQLDRLLLTRVYAKIDKARADAGAVHSLEVATRIFVLVYEESKAELIKLRGTGNFTESIAQILGIDVASLPNLSAPRDSFDSLYSHALSVIGYVVEREVNTLGWQYVQAKLTEPLSDEMDFDKKDKLWNRLPQKLSHVNIDTRSTMEKWNPFGSPKIEAVPVPLNVDALFQQMSGLFAIDQLTPNNRDQVARKITQLEDLAHIHTMEEYQVIAEEGVTAFLEEFPAQELVNLNPNLVVVISAILRPPHQAVVSLPPEQFVLLGEAYRRSRRKPQSVLGKLFVENPPNVTEIKNYFRHLLITDPLRELKIEDILATYPTFEERNNVRKALLKRPKQNQVLSANQMAMQMQTMQAPYKAVKAEIIKQIKDERDETRAKLVSELRGQALQLKPILVESGIPPEQVDEIIADPKALARFAIEVGIILQQRANDSKLLDSLDATTRTLTSVKPKVRAYWEMTKTPTLPPLGLAPTDPAKELLEFFKTI